MLVSAIVPTHNRPQLLHDCLKTLMNQDVSSDQLELVVVDDGSDSADVGAVVAAIRELGPFAARCERQPPSGLNGARNHGVAVARGDVLAFLDDDTLLAEGWAKALLRAFEDPRCAAVGGRVDLDLPAPEPEWMTDFRCLLAAYDLGPEPRWLAGDDPVPVGANCAVRRSEFDRLGGFAGGLDRIGRSLVSNGDTEFFRRLRSVGGSIRYEPAARVAHRVPSDRLTVRFFIRRQYAQGISDELMTTLEGHAPGLGDRVGYAREIGRAAGMLCADLARGRGTVVGRLMVGYWAGRLVAVGMPPPDGRERAAMESAS